MNYNNITIIWDNELYILYNNKNYIIRYDNKILNSGCILNSEKFIEVYLNFVKKNKLYKLFFNKNIQIIYDDSLSYTDVLKIKQVFNSMNYKNIYLKSYIKYMNITKNKQYILNINNKYKLYYRDQYNIIQKVISKDNLLISELLEKYFNTKEIIYVGNINFDFKKIDKYYLIDKYYEFFLKKIK